MALTEEEKKKLGMSDAGAIMGVSRFKTPIDVFNRVVLGLDSRGNDATEWGEMMEPVNRQMYQKQTGCELLGPQKLQYKPMPFVRASLDDVAVKHGHKKVLEIKNPYFMADSSKYYGDGNDDIPEEYIIQAQGYMKVADLDTADVSVLLPGRGLRIYALQRDAELQEAIFETLAKFWKDHILPKKPPEIDGSEGASKWLSHRIQKSNNAFITAPADADKWAREYRAALDEIDALDARRSLALNKLSEMAGNNKYMYGNGWKFTYKDHKGKHVVDWVGIWQELQKVLSPDQQLDFMKKYSRITDGHRVPSVTFKEDSKVAA